ncbi:hypothetical protein V7182_23815 [Neobacillus drentensis]|uniref:hypothetical protein n=1 Tax=Neobacillus drentensis TaxID=220684 RepID=UPI002FFDF57D
MLKNKVKSLQKELTRISNSKMNGVYFVDFWDEVFVIKAAGGKNIFQGSHQEYKEFISKYEKSVFIVDDIPRSSGEPTLSEFAN